MIKFFCSVSDTGSGISKENMDKLFIEYSRFGSHQVEGTGLGMSITKNLVHMMGGEISVESELDKGTIFTVWVPQKVLDSNVLGKELVESMQRFRFNNTSQKKTHQINREYMPYGSVLIVDDVETNLYVAEGLLIPYGLKIDAVTSGFEAIEKIKSGKEYDIIFMDHMMPKMDGVEAVKIIRELGYDKTIVALTANAVSGQAKLFLDNGFDGFVAKPIDLRQLNLVLNVYIRDKKSPEVVEDARNRKKIKESFDSMHSDKELAKFFCRDAQKAAKVMEVILKNIKKAPADNFDDDLRLFIINAHAMKSALANIGEIGLSQDASALEKAGKERDRETIINKTQELINSLKDVVAKMEAELDKNTSTIAEDRDYLREKLETIRDACIDYNEKSASEAILKLKEMSWTQATKRHIDEIFEYLLHSDFEEAAELAKNLLEKNGG